MCYYLPARPDRAHWMRSPLWVRGQPMNLRRKAGVLFLRSGRTTVPGFSPITGRASSGPPAAPHGFFRGRQSLNCQPVFCRQNVAAVFPRYSAKKPGPKPRLFCTPQQPNRAPTARQSPPQRNKTSVILLRWMDLAMDWQGLSPLASTFWGVDLIGDKAYCKRILNHRALANPRISIRGF